MKSLHFKFILLLSLSIVLNYTLAAKTIAQHLIESELSNTKLQVDTSQPHILPHQAKALTQIVENTMPIKTIEIKDGYRHELIGSIVGLHSRVYSEMAEFGSFFEALVAANFSNFIIL